jgi:2-dehydro-3-deoxygluconokinase
MGETMALLCPTSTGLLRHAGSLALTVGGSESNVAIAAQRLGTRSAWVGRVGDDEMGARVVREIRAEGVETFDVVDSLAPTGLMIKERRSSSQTRLWYYRAGSAGSRLRPGDIDESVIAAAQILHVSGITPGLSDTARAAVEYAIEVARRSETVVSIDLNYRRALWKAADFGAVLRELLPAADIVFGSSDEVSFVVGDEPDGPEAQAIALSLLGPSQCVIKLGGDGCVALVDGTMYQHGAFPVSAVDTVGAGDAFVAGWLSELLAQPADVSARLRTASACGAFACTVLGDWEGAPNRADLKDMIDPGDGVLR